MRNTFNILFFIKKNEPKKNGRTTVMVRITINGEKAQFSSGIDVQPDQWDQRANMAKGKSKESRIINTYLEEVRMKIRLSYMELSNKHILITPDLVKNDFLGINEKATLLSQFRELLKSYEPKIDKTVTKETHFRYELTMRRIQEFLKESRNISDIDIRKVDTRLLEDFEIFLRTKFNYSHNHTMKYMQRVASVFLFADRNGILHQRPFKDYTISLKPTDPIFLTGEEITAIANKRFKTYRLRKIRDVFVFCCFTGLSYADVCKLTRSNITQDFEGNYWIKINRTKTDIKSQIPLLPQAQKILGDLNAYYPEDRIFSVSTNQKTNEYLKEIATICKIDKPITFHTARHSFAVMVLNSGVSLESLSKMLGHTNTKTTQVYTRILDGKIKKEMERLIPFGK